MKHMAFKCCECGVINVFESYRQDGNRCMKCDGYLNPIGNCLVHNISNILKVGISVDTLDIDKALKKINLLNDRINDTVLKMSKLEDKNNLMDRISDLIKEYWINTGMKDDGIKQLADKLQDMADKMQIEEYEYQINKEGIELFRTYWIDLFGELSEEFWKRYRSDKEINNNG